MEGDAKKILIDFVALYSLNDIDNIVGEVYQQVIIDFYFPGIAEEQQQDIAMNLAGEECEEA